MTSQPIFYIKGNYISGNTYNGDNVNGTKTTLTFYKDGVKSIEIIQPKESGEESPAAKPPMTSIMSGIIQAFTKVNISVDSKIILDDHGKTNADKPVINADKPVIKVVSATEALNTDENGKKKVINEEA